MTTSRSTLPAFSFRRATIALLMAFGVSLTTLVSPQPAEAAGHTFTIAGKTVTAPSWPAKVAVWTALAQRGDPYRWGGAGPSSFDCSGLTQYVAKRVGTNLPHSSRMQSTTGRWISRSNLAPGDLVFFYSPVSHVAMYIGNGRIVHAPSSGSVVRVDLLAHMPQYMGARRVF
jgi:cell wall-associated NlpC family hydrolase